MKHKINMTFSCIEAEQAEKISRYTINWRGYQIDSKAFIDEIISFCTDWHYEGFAEKHEQIMSLDFPAGVLSVSMAKELQEKLNELEEACHKESSEKGEYSKQQIARWHMIMEETKDELQKIIEGRSKDLIWSEVGEDIYCEEEEIHFEAELEEHVIGRLQWLYEGYKSRISRLKSWQDTAAVVIGCTLAELQMLQGGCRLRIPLHLIDMTGAEKLEELLNVWSSQNQPETEQEAGRQVEQEPLTYIQQKVIAQAKKTVHEAVWKEFQKRLERNRENGENKVIYNRGKEDEKE